MAPPTKAPPADAPTAVATDEPKKRTPRPRCTFMLHDPKTFSSLGKYVSTDYRYAALKVASRGVTDIYLRKTNSKQVYVFSGKVVELDTPQVVKRGERTITYSKKPHVVLVRKFVWDGELPDDDSSEENATESVEKSTEPKQKRMRKAETVESAATVQAAA